MMKKYWRTYVNGLGTFLQYRLNLWLVLFSHTISLMGLFALWISVYASGQTIGAYTLQDILLYYVLITVVRSTVANGIPMGFQMVEDINQGTITNYLLKPFSYAGEKAVKQLAEVTIHILLLSPLFVFLIWLAETYAVLPPLHNIGLFILFACISGVFYYFIYFLAALSSFWLTSGRSVIYGMIVINSLLAGQLIPLDLFPSWFVYASNYTPFQFLAFTPVQVFLGKADNIPMLLVTAVIWMLLLFICMQIVWRLGIRKFEAVGR